MLPAPSTVSPVGEEIFAAVAAPLSPPYAQAPVPTVVVIVPPVTFRIRKVTGGTITTTVGTGACAYGGDNGAATAAKISSPTGLTVDGAGNIYIADTSNCRIRRVSEIGRAACRGSG